MHVVLFLALLLCSYGYERVSFPIELSKKEAVTEYAEGKAPHILRILVIGDENDNLALQDWCKADPQRALHTDKSWWKRTTFSASKKYLTEYMKPYGKRRKSWEVRLCESLGATAYVDGLVSEKMSSRKGGTPVLIASMMNKFGVKTAPPFNKPVATLSGLDGKEAANFSARESWTVGTLFQEANAPCLRLLCDAMGGLPDVVLVHSMHQDLSHPPNYKSDSFVRDWEKNTTELLHTVKAAFPTSAAFYTRSGNKFAIQDIEGHWNTNDNLNHMKLMNERLAIVSKPEGYHVIDFAAITDPSWYADKMRPSFEENVEYMNLLVKLGGNRVRSRQKLDLKSTFERAGLTAKQKKRARLTRRKESPKAKGKE